MRTVRRSHASVRLDVGELLVWADIALVTDSSPRWLCTDVSPRELAHWRVSRDCATGILL
jgi:hypothetical protein